jgi:tryptophan-rich sensory protein
MWTWLFFVWRQGAIAFVEILALWLLVAATIVSFARMHRMAAALLAPYLTWVTFATALCYSCWKLNPGLLR